MDRITTRIGGLPEGSVVVLTGDFNSVAEEGEPWRMAVIADLHYGLAPDAMARLQSFMGDVLSKVEAACAARERDGLEFAIEIDGGIDSKTAAPSREAGVDILVAGTSIFKSGNYGETIAALRG